MSTQQEGQPIAADASSTAAALDELLQRVPNALVAALRGDGAGLGPVPASVPLHGQRPFERGPGIDLVVPEDQVVVLDAWARAATEPVVTVESRLLADPTRMAGIHFFDLRAEHGAHIVVLDASDPDAVWRSMDERDALRNRVGHMERDAEAVILEVDEGTTNLLGWSAAELVGRRTVDLVHPDDVERAFEGWMAMRAGTGSGRARVRYQHALGHYVWLEVTNDNRLGDLGLGVVRSELTDVSEEMAQLEAVRERERLVARVADVLPIGVCHIRPDGEVLYANEPLNTLLGTIDSRYALVQSVVEDDQALVAIALDHALLGRSAELEVEVLRGPEARRCELTFRPLAGDTSGIDGVIVCAADVTDRSRLRAELEHRANHDALSGCLNRAATEHALERALRTAPKVAVAFIDLDGLKGVNDDLGHAAGDELLRVAAARLRGAIRDQDRLGRMGGDEFVVVAPQGHGPIPSTALLRRLRGALTGDVWFAGHRIPLRASVGVALSEPGEIDAEAVLVRADAAMYEAKRGR